MYEQEESFERTGSQEPPHTQQPGDQPPRFPPLVGEEGKHGRGKEPSMRNVGRKVQHEAVGALKEEGSAIGGEVRHYIEDAAHSGKERIADRLHHVSEALHRAAESLQNEDEETSGRIAGRAADQIDRVCNYLHDHQASDLIREADRLARQQPALFIGGALATGVLLARFLRSSRPQDSERDGGHDENRFEKQEHSSGRGFAEAHPPDADDLPTGNMVGPSGTPEVPQPPGQGPGHQPTRMTPMRPEARPMEGGF